MSKSEFQNLEDNLSVLGKNANLSLSQKQAIRDKIFKKIGQHDLIDSMQTKTESLDLVMPLKKLQDILRPRRVTLSLPATLGLLASVFVATVTTGAIAQTAQPGDPLFGVKKAIETVQVAFVIDPVQKATIQLSIADNLIQGLADADPAKLEIVLNESKKALASAQTSVTALKDADEVASTELLNKLKDIIDSQRSILATIIKENIDDEDITRSIVAVRAELDEFLPKPETVGENDEIPNGQPADGFVNLTGTMGSYTAKPVIMVDDVRYFLIGSDIDLIPYMGSTGAIVAGDLQGDTIVLSKVFIDGKAVFEASHNNLNQSADGGTSAL